jgi:uncharacterized protein with PQ loop repeat
MDFSRLVDPIGPAGAVLTTLCWLPQVMKAVRDKETGALALTAVILTMKLRYG